jgi:hypothetical protein
MIPEDDDYDPRIVDDHGAITDEGMALIRRTARILGARGGSRNTPAQQAARKRNAGAPRRDPYGCRYHRDGTVTYWSVYRQVWCRVSAADISDETLSTLTSAERDRIAKHAARHAQ